MAAGQPAVDACASDDCTVGMCRRGDDARSLTRLFTDDERAGAVVGWWWRGEVARPAKLELELQDTMHVLNECTSNLVKYSKRRCFNTCTGGLACMLRLGARPPPAPAALWSRPPACTAPAPPGPHGKCGRAIGLQLAKRGASAEAGQSRRARRRRRVGLARRAPAALHALLRWHRLHRICDRKDQAHVLLASPPASLARHLQALARVSSCSTTLQSCQRLLGRAGTGIRKGVVGACKVMVRVQGSAVGVHTSRPPTRGVANLSEESSGLQPQPPELRSACSCWRPRPPPRAPRWRCLGSRAWRSSHGP